MPNIHMERIRIVRAELWLKSLSYCDSFLGSATLHYCLEQIFHNVAHRDVRLRPAHKAFMTTPAVHHCNIDRAAKHDLQDVQATS